MTRKLLIVLLSTVLASCGSVYRPKAPVPNSIFTNNYLADLSSPTLLAAYDAMPDGPAKIVRRNQILYELIWLTDKSYGKYEAGFFSGQAYMSTAADSLNIALAGVASVTGTAHLKAVLAAFSGGLTGIRASYEKNFFDQATRESVVQVMRASRATILAQIETGMADCLSTVTCPANSGTYTLEQGLMDATAYYDAGTVVDALVSISATSARQTDAAKQVISSLHRR